VPHLRFEDAIHALDAVVGDRRAVADPADGDEVGTAVALQRSIPRSCPMR
jgi:hypothetical protein